MGRDNERFTYTDEDIKGLVITKNGDELKASMTEQQKKFIWLVFGEKKTYAEVEKELNVSRAYLTKWAMDFSDDCKKMSAIKKIHSSKLGKGMASDFKSFYDWYITSETEKHCEYCQITEAQIKILNERDENPLTKRKRGEKLELDRKLPNGSYTEDNIVYACYWCNNAKTDTFTHDEFLEIGKAISSVWKKRLDNATR